MTPTWWSSFRCRMVLGEGGFSSSPTLRAENIKQSQYKFTFLKKCLPNDRETIINNITNIFFHSRTS